MRFLKSMAKGSLRLISQELVGWALLVETEAGAVARPQLYCDAGAAEPVGKFGGLSESDCPTSEAIDVAVHVITRFMDHQAMWRKIRELAPVADELAPEDLVAPAPPPVEATAAAAALGAAAHVGNGVGDATAAGGSGKDKGEETGKGAKKRRREASPSDQEGERRGVPAAAASGAGDAGMLADLGFFVDTEPAAEASGGEVDEYVDSESFSTGDESDEEEEGQVRRLSCLL